MLTLPAAIETERVKTANAPVTQVVVTFPSDGYVKRIASVGHTYDSYAYAGELLGDVTWEQALSGKFDNCSFTVNNENRGWTDLLNTYTAPEIQMARVEVYETFLGLTVRQKQFTGILELPKDVNRASLKLTATHILNNIREQFCDLVHAPTCQWARKGYFADSSIGRCPYSGGPTYGQCATLTSTVTAGATSWPVSDGTIYVAGDYVQAESEIAYVSEAYPLALTVVRGQKGTSPAGHGAGTKVLHQSCDGTYEACGRRLMQYRFGGLKFFPVSGSYYYKQKVWWFISQKMKVDWQAEGNTGIFGTPWGVCYGTTRVMATPLYVRDPGNVAVFFAGLGCGPIAGKVNPPSAFYNPTQDPPGNACVIINGKPYGSGQIAVGADGVDLMPPYGSMAQGYQMLWTNPPTTNPTIEANETNAQTYSRMAYVAGAFPTDVKTVDSMPEVAVYVAGRVLPFYDSSGVYQGSYYTNNPAWIYFDMLTNPDYGAGIALDQMDYASITAAYNDFDSAGFTFNAFLQDTMPLVDAIQLLCNSTRSYPTYNDGKLGLKVIKPTQAATSFSVDSGDYVAGSCRYWVDGPNSRDSNVLSFNITDPAYDYQSVPVTFSDQENIDACGGKKKNLSLKVAGVQTLAQAQEIGSWQLNLSKISRRQDGALKLTLIGSLGMPVQPGDIITVDATPVNGFAATQYLVWSVKRTNNNGNRELGLIKWDTGLFELCGINYDTPFSAINPTLEPLPVEDLAAETILIGDDDVRVTVSWTWPENSPPTPAPARVYLWIGEREATPDTLELMTPNGLPQEVTSYQTTFPRRRWKAARVYALGQSSFGIPPNVRPAYRGDADAVDTLSADVTATGLTYNVDATGTLIANVSAGDFVAVEYMGKYEINKVVSKTSSSVTVEAWGGNRRPFYGTTAVLHKDGDHIFKLEWTAPWVNVDMFGPVMPPTDTHAYDKNRDPDLAWNEIRFEIPKNENGTPPKHLHVQFDADNVWVDPTESPDGNDDAWLDEPMASVVYVPTTYNLDTGIVGKLFVIKEIGDRVGRYIESIEQDVVLNGATLDRITVQGHLPRGSGYHDWAIWDKWYELQDHQFTVSLSDQNLDLNSGTYKAVVTLPGPYTGYARVYLLNEWSTSDPVVAVDDSELPALLTTDPANAIDTDPAPLCDNFDVGTPEGYTLPDGSQKVMLNISFNQPDPKLTFSHLLLLADRPSTGIAGKEGDTGWLGTAGYYKEIIGEVYESGTPIIMEPSKPSAGASVFYAISVNLDGYYPIDWGTHGENQPGGYRKDTAAVLPENTAPPASSSVVATFNPGAGINVVWDAISILDLDYWEVEARKAATEAGLAAAAWDIDGDPGKSTWYAYFPLTAENGYWFQWRVRAVDNTGNLGAWAESNNVQAYAGASLQPVQAPLNFGAAWTWEYRNGVPFAYLTFSWDNPPDPNYGGCEVWIFYPSDAHGELYDRVGYQETPQSLVIMPMLGQLVTMRLVPYNRSGIVPDYGVFVQNGAFTLSQATFGESVPAPNITARDGVGRVSIEATIPPWGGMQKPYANLCLFISATNDSATAQMIGKWPVGHASGSNEKMHIEVPFDALANVAGGPYTTGTNYYFWARLESSGGALSSFSSDTDYSAVFIAGNLTDSGAADFAAGAEVMRVAASDKMIFAGWNAPTVNGTTVYLSQLQVARASTFTTASLVEDYTINAKAGSKGVGLPQNGTYYLRVRYLNNSAAGWSEWFGLKEGGAAYATVCTQADQTGDTGYMDGATYITGTYTTLEQQDALQVKVKVSSSATNCATLYNITALWGATQADLSDDTAGFLISSPTLTWLDNDSWISTGTTAPATTWIGKVLQYKYNASPALWISGIITQVDITNKKVQLNVNWGAAKTSQVGRVITPYWERPGVFFKELGEDCGWHIQKNINYTLPAINQFASGTTVYFRLIPSNIFGPGTSEDFSISVGSKAGDVITKSQGYTNNTAPTGTFASGGYQWAITAPNTVDFNKTFSYTQATDVNAKADAFVIVIKSGGGTPDPAADPKLVFPVNHASGAQSYSLKVPNLDPFTTYSFRTYAAKTGVSGMILSAASGTTYLADTDLQYTTSNDLILKTISSSGRVICRDDSNQYFTPLYAGTIYIRSASGAITVLPFAELGATAATGSGKMGLTLRTGDASPTTGILDFRWDNAATALQVRPNSTSHHLYLGNESGTGDVHVRRKLNADAGEDVTGELTATTGLTIKTAGYQYPLKMGDYTLWVNATSGKLYIKNGTPTSDTDGTIVGTQS